jgi:flagellar FliL protein
MEPFPSKKPKKPMKTILIVLGLILLLGAGSAWIISKLPRSEETGNLRFFQRFFLGPGKESRGTLPGHIYRMDPFIVNLNDEQAMRYLKIKIEFESDEEKANDEYGRRLPQLRDAILTILSAKNHQEIMSSEGKKILKEELKQRLNNLLQDFRVQKIYFTEFVIQ